MRYSLFHKRLKTPPLVEGQKDNPKQKIERLKAGRLASTALALTRSLLEQFGPRPSGSDACRQAAAEIERSLAPFCDRTEQSEVTLDLTFHSLPLSLMAYLYPVLLLLALFKLPLLSLLLFGLYGGWVVITLYYYRPLFKVRGKSVTGINVHGTLEPKGEVRHTVIFSAHHDSARLHRHNRLDRSRYLVTVALPILSLPAGLPLHPPLWPHGIGMTIIQVVMLALTPRFVALLRFYDDRATPVPGTTSTQRLRSSSCPLLRLEGAGGEPLESTRPIFCSFDGEEIGPALLRGMKSRRSW